MFKKFWILFIFALMVLSGCPETGVLTDGLIITDNVPNLNVLDVKDDEIILSSGASGLVQSGDIIVGTAKGGFLRKIESTNESKGNILSKTSKASLSEAVENGLMMTGFSFTTEDFINSGLIKDNENITILDFSNKDIYRDYGISLSVSDGTIECVPDVYLAASWKNFKLDSFNLLLQGEISLNLDIELAVDDKTQIKFETDMFSPIIHPFATSIGPIPVVGVAKLNFPIGVVGNFDGNTGITAGFDVVDNFKIGASYKTGKWDNCFEFGSPIFSGYEPVWVIEVGVDFMVYVKVVGSVSLYDSAELNAYLQPYLFSNIDVYPVFYFDLIAGINAGFSYGLSIFDYRILGNSYIWNGPSHMIYSYTNVN